MDLILFFVLAASAGAAAVAGVVVWSTQRAASSALTSYFKASEHILETGEPPPEWRANPKRKRLFRSAGSSATHPELMARFDDLVRFFEGCRFFEDEWAREQMLAQLATIRENWQDRARE
ncbi:MAG: hypothetical protein OXG78_17700 [Chloroflexi bacterium]|nr:hypothetical protein [Chloroflexota bacterium]